MSRSIKRPEYRRPAAHPKAAQVPHRLQKAFALLREGRLAQAELNFGQILKIDPLQFEALNCLGMIAGQTGNSARAAIWFDKAIRADSTRVHAYVNRGLALHACMQLEAALASYEDAIRVQSDYTDAHFNRGNVLLELGRLPEALASYDATIALDPERADARGNHGVVLSLLRRFTAAVESFNHAIRLRPEHGKWYLNRAFARLIQGDFSNGWADYEWRGTDTSSPAHREFSKPRWNGSEPLVGRTVLLWSEQGFGDTIQFCRYVQLLAAAGGRVLLEVQRPLLSLLANLEGTTQVLAKGEAPPPFDLHSPLLSLPLAFGTGLESIPLPRSYLRSDPRKSAQWRQRLGEKTRPRVGLVWSGSATNRTERHRRVPLAELLGQLPPEYEYFRLQKDGHPEDLQVLRQNSRVRDFSTEFNDFSDTAALCDSMDVIVSTCTSVAHLSAALGVRTFVLLGQVPDWRWLLERSDSPWYASVQLFRRGPAEDWRCVLERLARELTSALG
ncbi:MAG: tetratricopeptide repeat-containing glycosyltransferase family protein [Steroidobacteraceae bacterium]